MFLGGHVGFQEFHCAAYGRQFYLHQTGSDKIACASRSEIPKPFLLSAEEHCRGLSKTFL